MFFAFWVEFMLTVCLSYVQVFNTVFGTRDVLFIHYGTGALPFALVMLIWAEGRKYLVTISIIIFRFVVINLRLHYQAGGKGVFNSENIVTFNEIKLLYLKHIKIYNYLLYLKHY